MARKRRSGKLRPRTPSRVRKQRRKRRVRSRGHHLPELAGLALAALGVLLASVLYLGWDGGAVGGAVVDAFETAIGSAAYVAPLGLIALGALMLARSELVAFAPFRSGLAVVVVGGLLTLGDGHGGVLGSALEQLVAYLAGGTGATIAGVTLLTAGLLLVSGASAGAILRRSGHVIRRAGVHARRLPRTVPRRLEPMPAFATAPVHLEPPIDVEQDFPDVVVSEALAPPPLLVDESEEDVGADQQSLFDVRPTASAEYRLPERDVLRRSKPTGGSAAEQGQRVAEILVQTLAHFGIDATVVGQISGRA